MTRHRGALPRSRPAAVLLLAAHIFALCASASPAALRRQLPMPAGSQPAAARPVLRWGGDAEGGAPFVEVDPNEPRRSRGFDVEVAALIAEGLDRTPQFVQVAWASIDVVGSARRFRHRHERCRGHARAAVAARRHDPYFEFREVLTVRRADAGKYRSLADLKGRRVGTLGGTQRTSCCSTPRARTASSPSPTTTTCIRTRTSRTVASTPCCWTTSSRPEPSAARLACSPSRRSSRSAATSSSWLPARRRCATA